MAGAVENEHRPRRNFRERRDPLNEFSDVELIKRYRFDRQGIIFVTDLVREALQSPTNRNMPLTPEMKVLLTLRYLAKGKMQLCNSDDLGPSQPSVSNAITQTLYALASPPVFKRFIHFPRDQNELRVMAEEFRGVAGFPGVAGVVDGTHVRIVAPSQYEEEYVNRKNYHSVNIQLVFDANYRILDIVAKWPGSVHDSRIWNECGLERLFVNNRIPAGYHLLGDSGYPSKPHLLTPYLHPQPGPQTRYNRAHKRTRNIVERGIGQLKRRFHILHGEVRVTPGKTYKIVIACAMLHNICKARNIALPRDGNDDDNAVGDEPGDDHNPQHLIPMPAPDQRRGGLIYRDEFAMANFNPDE